MKRACTPARAEMQGSYCAAIKRAIRELEDARTAAIRLGMVGPDAFLLQLLTRLRGLDTEVEP